MTPAGARRGLEPGERLRARTSASFRGATAASTRSTFALGSARVRRRAFEAWRIDTEAVGFPTAGPDMVLGVTDERLVVCRTSFFLGRIVEIEGDVPLSRIRQVATVRHGLVTSLGFLLDNSQVVEVEAMRARGLRRFADELRTALAEHNR